MSKVIWYSQHDPTPTQVEAIRKLYPDLNLQKDPEPFRGADDIVSRFLSEGAIDMHVVAPMGVVRELCVRGLFPLWSVMRQTSCSKAEVHVHKGRKWRCYTFHTLHRVKDIKMILEDPTPNNSIPQ